MTSSQRGELRIIGGQWRRSTLKVADQPGLRPTPQRLRETLFNWLGPDLTGWHCLDAFAGSGALGFEAASRGASKVLLVEQNPKLIPILNAAALKLRASAMTIECSDAIAALQRQSPASLDLVLLDPPFASAIHSAALKAARVTLKPRAWVFLEAAKAWAQSDFDRLGYRIHRLQRVGQVWGHLLGSL